MTDNPLPNRDYPYSRRHYSRRQALGLGAFGLAALAGVPGCGGDDDSDSETSPTTTDGGATSFEGETLNLFTWASYHDKTWLADYEKSRGVKVNTQLYGGVPDGFAKVQANPEAFDIVVPTSGWVETYVAADLLVPIDDDRVPNLANVTDELAWQDATEVDGTNYAILYNWGNEPLCWLPSEVETPTSFEALYDPAVAGKVSLVDDPTTVMPFIPIMLGFDDPFDLDDAEFQEMSDKLMDLRGQVTHVAASIEDQTADFANRQVTIGVLYNISTQVALRDDGIQLEQIIPDEGAAVWTDNYAITKAGEAKADLCYDFMNYTLSIPWQARFAAESSNTSVLTLEEAESPEAVQAGLTKEALNRTLLPLTAEGPAFFDQLKVLQQVPNLDAWLDLWNEFKTGL